MNNAKKKKLNVGDIVYVLFRKPLIGNNNKDYKLVEMEVCEANDKSAYVWDNPLEDKRIKVNQRNHDCSVSLKWGSVLALYTSIEDYNKDSVNREKALNKAFGDSGLL